MISPEVLRRYPFFGFLEGEGGNKVAMLAEEVSWKAEACIFESGGKADKLYVLIEGEIDLRYYVEDTAFSHKSKEFSVGEVNPGEPFGLSSLLGAKEYGAHAIARTDCKGIAIDASELLKLAQSEPMLGYGLMQAVAKSTFERLDHVRVQLVAASQ
jgi:CRP/FNR family cyclic AMP-dependent transcriptional regulator